jgi:hypothetical protein
MQALEHAELPSSRRMSRAEDAVTLALSAWLVFGIYLDGWAHNTGTMVEGFFTPWHAALYSGFAVSAGWISFSVWRRRLPWGSRRDTVPAGYAPAVAGAIVFLVSGAADLTWHLVFGIERGVSALLSPTHLGLFVGGLLIITAPLRAAWTDPDHNENARFSTVLPAVGSAALAGCVTIFILQEFAQLRDNSFVTVSTALGISFIRPISTFTFTLNVEAGIAAFVIGSLTLFVPVLLLARRFRVTGAMVASVMLTQVILLQALQGFSDAGLVVLGVAGTGVVCLLAKLLRPRPSQRWTLLAFAGMAPTLFWGVFLLGVGLHDHGLGWRPEVWGGGLVWSALSMVGVAMALTAAPVARAPGAVASGDAR